VVLGVGFEVLGEAQDAFREERDLHIGAACVFRVEAKAIHFICCCCFCHFVFFLVLEGRENLTRLLPWQEKN
jgi:hypothetical protein